MKLGQTFEMKLSKIRLWLLLVLATASGMTLVVPHAFAGSLTKTTIQEIGGASFASPMVKSAGQAFVLDFVTVGSGATSILINFNNFSGGSVNGTQTVDNTNCTSYFSTASNLPSTPTPSVATNTITLSGTGSLLPTHEYCVILSATSAVTNPSTAGVYSALVTVGSDSQSAAFDVIDSSIDSNAYTITGTVAPTFTMSLGGVTTDSFSSNLSATALTVSTGVAVTVNTNAASGWSLYAKDTNAGLHSTSANHTIASVATGSNQTMNGGTIGTEAYALGVSANATANYAYNGGTTGGGLSSSVFNQIASSGTVASNVSQTLHELVDVAGSTAAASDYSDTITVIGAGQF